MRKLLPGVGVVQIGEWFAKKTPSRANGGTQGMMVNRVGGGRGWGRGTTRLPTGSTDLQKKNKPDSQHSSGGGRGLGGISLTVSRETKKMGQQRRKSGFFFQSSWWPSNWLSFLSLEGSSIVPPDRLDGC